MINNIPSQVLDFLVQEQIVYKKSIDSTDNVDLLRDITKDALFQIVIPYYGNLGYNVNYSVFNFLLEPLKNANFHGGNLHPHKIDFDLFLTPKALVSSYFDGGDYFKRQDIKEKWESKINPGEKHHISNKEIGFGAGIPLIFAGELVYVDIFKGKLYTGLSINHKVFSLKNKLYAEGGI